MLKANANRAKWFCFGGDDSKSKIWLIPERLDKVRDFLYLESIFSKEDGSDAEVVERVMEGVQVAGPLWKIHERYERESACMEEPVGSNG